VVRHRCRPRPAWHAWQSPGVCYSPTSVDLVSPLVIGPDPCLRWSRTTGTLMASPAYRSGSAAFDPPLMSLERDGSHRPLLEVGWWPTSTDLSAELRVLVSVLEQIRGPAHRLLLGAGDWASRPHEIVTDGRTVTVGYLAGQPAWMVTVLCADGGTFTVRVTPTDQPRTGPDKDTGEVAGGDLGQPANRAARAS
jgi:hypothetical protein